MSEDCHASNNADPNPSFEYQQRFHDAMQRGRRFHLSLSLPQFSLIDSLVNSEIHRICNEQIVSDGEVTPSTDDVSLLSKMGIRW